MFDNIPLTESIPALLLSGGALVMAIYHLLLFFQYREKIILRYCLYLFSITLYICFDLYFRSINTDIETRYFGTREAINFIVILTYASFLMGIAYAWKNTFPALFRTWNILTFTTLVFIGASTGAALLEPAGTAGIINATSGILKIAFVIVGTWAAILIVPRAKGRFVNLISFGAIGYLVFMVLVLIAMFFTPDRLLLGLSPIQWFYIGTFFEILVFSYAMSTKVREVLQRVTELRSRLSRDLHDDIGATLTSISFLSEVAKQPARAEEERTRSLEKIGEYSREMITEMSDIVWAINPANDRFGKITDRMKNFGLTLLSAKNISFHFHADEALEEIALNTQQRKNLYLVFKEAVNNAVKYSDCTELHVDLRLENPSLIVNIRDNGQGIKTAASLGGNGMQNMHNRASEIGGLLIIDTHEGGTVIGLQFPITQNA